MKKIPLVVALYTSVIALPVYAYQFEVEVGYTDSETDYDGNVIGASDTESDSGYVSGTYYFRDVETNNGPLSVASYLSRVSSISVLVSDGEMDVDSQRIERTGIIFGSPFIDIPGESFDTNAYVVGGQYIDADSGWLFEAAYGEAEVDGSPNLEIESYSVGVGKYIAENTRVILGYVDTDTDLGNSSLDEEEVNLALFHVKELGNDRYYDVSVGVAHIDSDDSDSAQDYSVSSTYYFSSRIGLGVNLSYTDGDDFDTTSYRVLGEWFVTDNFAISASYMRSNTNDDRNADFILLPLGVDTSDLNPDYDIDTFSVGAKLRF